MSFKEVSVSDLSFNPFTKIGKEWMLITSGDENKWNTMTASWGFVGVMWNKNVIETVIRPTRYTIEFVEKNDLFTVSFFDEEYRKALQFCGAHSGRDCDKAKETGLNPFSPTAQQPLPRLPCTLSAASFTHRIWISHCLTRSAISGTKRTQCIRHSSAR